MAKIPKDFLQIKLMHFLEPKLNKEYRFKKTVPMRFIFIFNTFFIIFFFFFFFFFSGFTNN